MMKHLKSIFSCALLAVMATACSDDIVDSKQDVVLGDETTTYVKISLVNTDGITRAFGDDILDKDKYENGSEAESKVNEILFVFFDQGRNYVGQSKVSVTEDNIQFNGNDNLTVERILTTVAEVNLPQNINHPSYLIAYVNPTSASADLTTATLEESMRFIRDEKSVSPNGMTMNNSVYFDEVTGLTRFATPVDFSAHFFKSEAEAKASPGVDITVERVQAKVRLEDFASIEANAYPNNGAVCDYTLEFTPETWFANATEKRTFLLKNFRNGSDNYLVGHMPSIDYGVNLAELKSRFAGAKDNRENYLNDETRKRSYWAFDPTYFYNEGLYPDVSYDVKYGNVNATGKSYPLTYRSYNNVLAESLQGAKKTHEYVLENTVNLQTLVSDDAKASLTSVVLLGHYVVKDKDGNVVFDGSAADPGTFYVRHNSSSNKQVMITDEDAKNFFLERSGSVLFVKIPAMNPDGTESTTEFVYKPLRTAEAKKAGVYDFFQLSYPTAAVAGSKLSEQWRTLSLKSNADLSKLYLFDGTINDYRAVTSADLADLSKRLYSAFGVLESFKGGKAYYNVPLKHIFGSGTSNEINAEKVQHGDFGVVRNHVYSLKINSINGLGTGIGDLNQPIVPPTEVDKYYISTRLNILKWRVVSQSVDL